uniref:peptidylprolyl isomerase n=1 Tax=Defluviitalea phaphyphila TaxID=1473580 RepID=UPI001FA77855|nr:peptidylprolyl isomerase [Defluviitalea phaphyphila]
MKKILLIIFILSFILIGCSQNQLEKETSKESNQQDKQLEEEYKTTQFDLPKEGEEIAIITTNKGVIKIRLFKEYAPKAVENFTTHAKNGYYDGLKFHRVINDFMIQGGDPKGDGTGGESIWKEPFEDEFSPYALHFRGAISMANSGPNTNGSQFFIVQKKEVEEEIIEKLSSEGYSKEILEIYKEKGGTPWLDNKHTVFGQVFEGMDVVDSIAEVEVDENNAPKEDVIIEKIEIVPYKG